MWKSAGNRTKQARKKIGSKRRRKGRHNNPGWAELRMNARVDICCCRPRLRYFLFCTGCAHGAASALHCGDRKKRASARYAPRARPIRGFCYPGRLSPLYFLPFGRDFLVVTLVTVGLAVPFAYFVPSASALQIHLAIAADHSVLARYPPTRFRLQVILGSRRDNSVLRHFGTDFAASGFLLYNPTAVCRDSCPHPRRFRHPSHLCLAREDDRFCSRLEPQPIWRRTVSAALARTLPLSPLPGNHRCGRADLRAYDGRLCDSDSGPADLMGVISPISSRCNSAVNIALGCRARHQHMAASLLVAVNPIGAPRSGRISMSLVIRLFPFIPHPEP